MKILEYCEKHPPIAYIFTGLWYAAIHGMTSKYVYISDKTKYSRCALYSDDGGKYIMIDSRKTYLEDAISPREYALKRIPTSGVAAVA